MALATCGLLVLQDLEDLRLEQTQAEIMLGNVLVRRFGGVVFGMLEAGRGDISVFEQRRQLSGNDLVRNAKGPADTDTDEPVEGVGAPPQPSPQVSDVSRLPRSRTWLSLDSSTFSASPLSRSFPSS